MPRTPAGSQTGPAVTTPGNQPALTWAQSTDKLSYGQLKAVWLTAAAGTQYATNAWASLMAAIALAESGGDPNSTNPTDNGGTQTSWGLWQISDGTHKSVSANWNNPVVNADLAIKKLGSNGNLTPWGTYDSGAYKAYLNDKTSPNYGNVPDGGGSVTAAAQAAGTQQQVQQQQSVSGCWWGIDLPVIGTTCLINENAIRRIAAVGLFAVSAPILAIGTLVLVAVGLQNSGALTKAADVAAVVPGGGGLAARLVKGADAVSSPGRSAARRQGARQRENEAEDRELTERGATPIVRGRARPRRDIPRSRTANRPNRAEAAARPPVRRGPSGVPRSDRTASRDEAGF